jgi:hypothetical protein
MVAPFAGDGDISNFSAGFASLFVFLEEDWNKARDRRLLIRCKDTMYSVLPYKTARSARL